MNYKHIAVKGVTWISGLRSGIRIITMVRIAILAHILTPGQFGEFGVATILLGLLEIITETGINVFLLQERSDPEIYVNTAWVISIIRGTLVAALIFLSAPFVSLYFHIPHLVSLIYLISLVALIRGFINPLIIKFIKNMEYHKEFAYRLSLILVEAAVTIALALTTHSVFSFAWGLIISAILEVTFSFLFINTHPKFKFSAPQAKTIINRGKWVTSYGTLDFLFSQGDNIAVGRIMNQTALGIYQNAYKFSALPLSEVGEVFYKVTLPIFVKLVEHPKRLKKAAIKSAIILSSVLFATSIGLFLLAEPIVLIVLGPSWTQAIPVVRVLAFLGFFRGISYSFNTLFLALQQQHKVTIITGASTIGLLVSIIPLVTQFGIMGAAYSAMFGSILGLIPATYYFIRFLSSPV